MMKQAMVVIAVMMVIAQGGAALASGADVTAAEAQREAAGTWRFSVTVRHADTGWEHYADEWQVIGPDGQVLGTRTLYHPHVGEQPFTRSLGGVSVPENVERVSIRAKDNQADRSGRSFDLELP